MDIDTSIITSLIEAALSADYTAVRRIGNKITKHLIDQNDPDSAKTIQSILRKKGVPLQASGYSETLPRDSASRLPLIEEGRWPTTPIMLNEEAGHTLAQFVEDAKHISLLAANGVSSRLAMLLFGPPGTGKSHLAGHVAAQLNRPFYIIRLDSVISSRLGETAKNIREIFEFIPARNAVLFLDEIDAIAKIRDDRHELGELKRVVNTVLQGLDSLGDEVITIAASNHAHLLDPAIWRRFPYKIELDLPDVDVRSALWSHFLFRDNSTRNRDAQVLAAISNGLNGADIENIALAARRREILQGRSIELSQVLYAVQNSKVGNPKLLDGRPVMAEENKNLARILDSASVPITNIASILGLTRQTVHRYLKDQNDG